MRPYGLAYDASSFNQSTFTRKIEQDKLRVLRYMCVHTKIYIYLCMYLFIYLCS